MKVLRAKHIALRLMVSLLFILCWLGGGSLLAQESDVSGLRTVSGSGVDLQARIYNYTTQSYDNKITWSNVDFSKTQGWELADQCLEITHTSPDASWGIQIYTDNKNNTSPVKDYNGDGDPAGLVGQTTRNQALSMAWVIPANWKPGDSIPDKPVEKGFGTGFSSGLWHYFKDKNTPDDPDTTDTNESFTNGEDYVTLWNQKGVAVSDIARTGNPAKIYVFLAADFSKATKQSYKTNSMTVEHFTDSSQSAMPFYIYKDGAPAMQMAFEFLKAKMDKYHGGESKRLMESYDDPYPWGGKESLERKAFIYDNALAICAFLSRPTDENIFRAKVLCRTLIWLKQNDSFNDGRLRDAYDAGGIFLGSTPPYAGSFWNTVGSGNLAWVINALMQYYKNSGDTDNVFLAEVLDTAKSIGEFVHSNFYDSSNGGYYHGFNQDGTTLNGAKSTEHNIALYVAFSHLYDITNESKWLTRANNAKSFVENTAWNNSDKRYIAGLQAGGSNNTDAVVGDANSLAVLANTMAGSNRMKKCLKFNADNLYARSGTIAGTSIWAGVLEGIDFGYNTNNQTNEPDGIWFEGTAQFAAAYKAAGQYGYTDDSARYIESLKRAQLMALNADGRSLPAASKDDLTTGIGWSYFASPHVAPTAWFAAVKMGYNMLWGTSLSRAVPSPGDNISYTPTASLMNDNFDYLLNHYAPSGWMNYREGVVNIDPRCADNPHSGDTSFKLSWTGHAGADGWNWAALVWQEPENEWTGGVGKGYDLRGAQYLSFWARTDSFSLKGSGDLKLKVYFGYAADSSGEIPPIWRSALTTSWQQYAIVTGSRDMSHVSNGFTIVFNDENTPRHDNQCNIYIDDIEFKRYGG